MLYFLVSPGTTLGQDSILSTHIEPVVSGSFIYPAYNAKNGIVIAQQRVDSYFQLFQIDRNGGYRQFTRDSANHVHANFSANGKWIAFTKESNGQRDIFLFRVETGEQVNLTNTASSNESHPAWAMDDNAIVFNTNRYDSLQEIAMITVDDRKVKRLTVNHDEDTYGSLSPDGHNLLYTKWLNEEKNPEIYVMSLQDGIEKQITNNHHRDVAPVWITDSLISFTQNGSIILYNLTTGAQKMLVTETGFRFGRGVRVSDRSLLCERTEGRNAAGLGVLHFED
jgi:tricorn protease-like protein